MQYNNLVDAKLQWICHAQSFWISNMFVVKELCFACVQTGEYYNFHITVPISLWVNLNVDDPLNQELYKVELAKHLIKWPEGCYQLKEVFQLLSIFLCVNNPIFIINKQLEKFLKTYGFNKVIHLKLPKLFEMNELPNSTCQNYGHDGGFKYCAQRSTLEIIYHLGPFLQPYLKPDSFRLVDNFCRKYPTRSRRKIYYLCARRPPLRTVGFINK